MYSLFDGQDAFHQHAHLLYFPCCSDRTLIIAIRNDGEAPLLPSPSSPCLPCVDVFALYSSGKKLSRLNLIKPLRVGARFRGVVMTFVLLNLTLFPKLLTPSLISVWLLTLPNVA
jgi:hypothetical protein